MQFPIEAILKATDAGFSSGMSGAEKQTEGFGKRTANVMKGVGKAVLAGTAAAGAALTGMAVKTAGTADDIHKASQRIGVSTDAYQEMDYWASQNGISQGSMERAVGRLNQRIGRAVDGNEKYSDAFEALGVNVKDTGGNIRDTEDVMADTIQSLSEIEDESMKSAKASEVFGTSLARQLMPALQDGSLSMEEAAEVAQDMGIVMDETAIEAGVAFQDGMDTAKRALSGIVMEIGAEVLPIFNDMLDWVISQMPTIRSVFQTVFGHVRTVLGAVRDIIANVIDWVYDNREAFLEFGRAVWDTMSQIWDAAQPVLQQIGELLLRLAQWIIDNRETWVTLASFVISSLQSVWSIVSPILSRIGGLLLDLGRYIMQIDFRELINQAKEFLNTWSPLIAGIVAGIAAFKAIHLAIAAINAIKGAWITVTKSVIAVKKALIAVKALMLSPIFLIAAAIGALIAIGIYLWQNWEEIGQKASEIWTGIKEFFSELWTSIGESWTEFWTGIAEFFTELWSSITEGARESWSAFREWLSELWSSIKETAVSMWTGLQDGLVEIITSIQEFITDIFYNIVEFLLDSWISIHTGIIDVLSNIFGDTNEYFNKMLSAIEDILMNIWNIIENILYYWYQTFMNILDLLIGIVTLDFGKMREAVSNQMELISSTISNIWSSIQSITSSILSAISNFIRGIFSSILSTTVNIFNNLRNSITNSINNIRNTVTNVLNSIRNTFSNIWNAVRNATVSAFTGVTNAIRNGIQNGLNAITNMFSNFKDAGRRVVTMIADGIRGAISSVTDAIGNVAGAIRDRLPFSPAKEGPLEDLHKLNFGGTIADSIDSGKKAVQGAMYDLVDVDIPHPTVNGDVNSTVQHMINRDEGNVQPAIIHMDMGSHTYRAYVDDITDTQEKNVRLEEMYDL